MANQTTPVNTNALRELLVALNGPEHLIRELQATRSLPGNPIIQLIEDFNAKCEELFKEESDEAAPTRCDKTKDMFDKLQDLCDEVVPDKRVLIIAGRQMGRTVHIHNFHDDLNKPTCPLLEKEEGWKGSGKRKMPRVK